MAAGHVPRGFWMYTHEQERNRGGGGGHHGGRARGPVGDAERADASRRSAVRLHRAARRGDPDLDLREREEESGELYARALKAHEARMEEDARHFAQAVLQIVPDHPFAKDFLARLDAGEGAAPDAPSTPRIILPD